MRRLSPAGIAIRPACLSQSAETSIYYYAILHAGMALISAKGYRLDGADQDIYRTLPGCE